ncbi:MAG TPA: hypothetical protein DDW76_31255 [Cyanobacteria bacterium UBA11369]|nr:hypothetical protein [Cyanobacteria bacterium UBA11371]HBE31893.1 hypothetical protein [Cyanobacteria bacterium UBA11368]HBE53120.1 hypothetical protein [Cyanobacteria bacterium UBA11369]
MRLGYPPQGYSPQGNKFPC